MERNPVLTGLAPPHPGELLREDVLPALGRSKSEIARLLRISRQHLYDLIEERKPVTPQMALRIGKLTGTTATSWLKMQSAYDLAVAEVEVASEIDQIPTLEAMP
jgi:addiction module HigA family antidote